jgi:hypothetical protein
MPDTAPLREPIAPARIAPEVTNSGIFLGPTPLTRRGVQGHQPIDDEALAETLAVAYSWDILVDFDARAGSLRAAAKALNDGALTSAHLALAFMNLPRLRKDAWERLQQFELLRKYNPNVASEPRDLGGRWTSASGAPLLAANQATVQSDAPDPAGSNRDRTSSR